MEKVEKFKKLCEDMEQRKADLANCLQQLACPLNNLRNYGLSNGLSDINNKLTTDDKEKLETFFLEVENKIKSQTDWIKEINDSFKDALYEIIQELERYLPKPFLERTKSNIERIAMVDRLRAIEMGESMIKAILKLPQQGTSQEE